MIPFTLKYSTRISNPSIESSQVLEHVKRAVEGKKCQIILVSNEELVYSGTTLNFPSNWNFAQSVDKGRFLISQKNSEILLEYEIHLDGLVSFSIGFSIIAGLASFNLWVGFGSLIWLGGVNMFLIYSRHRSFFQDIELTLNPRELKIIDAQTYNREVGIGTLVVLLIMVVLILLLTFA